MEDLQLGKNKFKNQKLIKERKPKFKFSYYQLNHILSTITHNVKGDKL